MKSILDDDFKYTPSFNTDIRKKFEEARDRIKIEQDRSAALIEAAEKQNRAIEEEASRIVAKTRIKGKAA